MTGQPTDQFPIVLERRHVEALLTPDRVRAELRQEARQLLGSLLTKPPVDNPREAGGQMIDTSGDPHAKGKVMFDTRRAVLMESIEAAIADTTRKGKPAQMVALTISGRINRPPDLSGERPAEHVSHLHFTDWGGAADLVVEIQALAGRAGYNLVPLLEEKWAAAEAAGWTTQRPSA